MSKEKVPFEIKLIFDGKMVSKGIFIDGQHFDWGVDEGNFQEAKEHAKELARKVNPQAGRAYMQSIQDSIQKHFLESLSEFMGREVTPEEVNEAQKTGLIDK